MWRDLPTRRVPASSGISLSLRGECRSGHLCAAVEMARGPGRGSAIPGGSRELVIHRGGETFQEARITELVRFHVTRCVRRGFAQNADRRIELSKRCRIIGAKTALKGCVRPRRDLQLATRRLSSSVGFLWRSNRDNSTTAP
jgi:hypothetical protein